MKNTLRVIHWIITVCAILGSLYWYNKALVYHDIARSALDTAQEAVAVAVGRCGDIKGMKVQRQH